MGDVAQYFTFEDTISAFLSYEMGVGADVTFNCMISPFAIL